MQTGNDEPRFSPETIAEVVKELGGRVQVMDLLDWPTEEIPRDKLLHAVTILPIKESRLELTGTFSVKQLQVLLHLLEERNEFIKRGPSNG